MLNDTQQLLLHRDLDPRRFLSRSSSLSLGYYLIATARSTYRIIVSYAIGSRYIIHKRTEIQRNICIQSIPDARLYYALRITEQIGHILFYRRFFFQRLPSIDQSIKQAQVSASLDI